MADVVREGQVETTARQHRASTRRTTGTSEKLQVSERGWRNCTSQTVLVEMQNGTAAVEDSLAIPLRVPH